MALHFPEDAETCISCYMFMKNPHPKSNVYICKLGFIHVMDMMTEDYIRQKKIKMCRGKKMPTLADGKTIERMTSLNGESLIVDESGKWF